MTEAEAVAAGKALSKWQVKDAKVQKFIVSTIEKSVDAYSELCKCVQNV